MEKYVSDYKLCVLQVSEFCLQHVSAEVIDSTKILRRIDVMSVV